jgi:syntaxin-binding protein 1
MPKFQSLKSKYSVHISLAKECMDIYSRTGLERICSVEQDLATGLDEENKNVTYPYDPLKPILNDQTVSKENKLRLLMLYYVTYPKAAASRKPLEGAAMLTEAEERLLTNWLFLIEQTSKTIQQRPPKNPQEWEYVVSRYQPSLFDTVQNLATGNLSTKDFPFLFKEEESEVQRPVQPTQQKKLPPTAWVNNKEAQPKKTGPRLIVFIAGGVSYPEIRIIHKLTQKPHNLDVILGSTHIVDPPLFLKQVAALKTSPKDEAFTPSHNFQI